MQAPSERIKLVASLKIKGMAKPVAGSLSFAYGHPFKRVSLINSTPSEAFALSTATTILKDAKRSDVR